MRRLDRWGRPTILPAFCGLLALHAAEIVAYAGAYAALLRSAYFHVLTDALTLVLAILGLLRGVGAVLLDAAPDPALSARVREALERGAGSDRAVDLHLWRLWPGHMALVVSVVSDRRCRPTVTSRGSPACLGCRTSPWRCTLATARRGQPERVARPSTGRGRPPGSEQSGAIGRLTQRGLRTAYTVHRYCA